MDCRTVQHWAGVGPGTLLPDESATNDAAPAFSFRQAWLVQSVLSLREETSPGIGGVTVWDHS